MSLNEEGNTHCKLKQ